MHRAGRSDFAASRIYIRPAEAVGDGFGEVFLPLVIASNWATEPDDEAEERRFDGQC